MRYIVTGHAGFIGTYLTKALEEHGHTWWGLDILDPDHSVDLMVESVFHRELLEQLMSGGVDAVIHLAAQPGRIFGEEAKINTLRLNTQMTLEIARVCGQLDVPLIYTSTSEVYGDRPQHRYPVDELSEPTPKNLYGMTKLWGEQVAELYAPRDLLIVRPTMPYGPDMFVGRGRAALPTFLYNAMIGDPITVHLGGQRSWCYIDDLIEAFITVIEKGDSSLGIYNIGRDDDLRYMNEIANLACEIAGADSDELVRFEEADSTITLVKNLSTQRLRDLGFEPKVDLEDGMRRTYESIKERGRFSLLGR